MAVRLSYSLITVASAWRQPDADTYRIHVEYASGRSMFLPGKFKTANEARAFIKRFYPDLEGKCTSIDDLNQKISAKPAAVNDPSNSKGMGELKQRGFP